MNIKELENSGLSTQTDMTDSWTGTNWYYYDAYSWDSEGNIISLELHTSVAPVHIVDLGDMSKAGLHMYAKAFVEDALYGDEE